MDERDFEKLFWVLYPQLMRYALFQLDPASAEDVVSDTFTTLWRKDLEPPSIPQDHSSVRALAFSVLVGHIRNEYRSRRRRRSLQERVISETEEPASERGLRHVEEDDFAQRLLATLSVEDREVILLFNAGFDIAETARILGCSDAAASKRRQRATTRLRTAYMNMNIGGATDAGR